MAEVYLCWPSEAVLTEEQTHIPGRPVLDLAPDFMNFYSCGTFSLVERDVKAVLPEECARAVIRVLHQLGVAEAFHLRGEVVNLKKAAYYVHREASSLERRLAQLATFFHGEHTPQGPTADGLLPGEPGSGAYWLQSDRLTELSDARMQCKGAMTAAHDTRAIGKLIASLPRHPNKPTPTVLLQLPESLHAWRAVKAAAVATSTAPAPAPAPAPASADSAADKAAGKAAADAADSAADNAPSTIDSRQAALLSALWAQGWPRYVVHFVWCVLVCRGADKALRICDEVRRAGAHSEARTLAELSQRCSAHSA